MSCESTSPLDRAVLEASSDLARYDVPPPRVLYLLGTGLGLLPDTLRGHGQLELGGLAGVPPAWRELELHHGLIGDGEERAGAWMIADVTADAPPEPGGPAPSGAPAWHAGFPCWLAAHSGATVMVHVGAGATLATEGQEPGLRQGQLALVRDHLNLSGSSPLVGLGDTHLGPLFPDLSRLHDEVLRASALACAAQLGIDVAEAVVACTPGPTRDTPAERHFLSRAGANCSSQGLAVPLLSAAHAGLSVLSIVALVDDGQGPLDLPDILGASQALAPALDDLLQALAPHLAHTANTLALELGT